jgi:hypothetical protein
VGFLARATRRGLPGLIGAAAVLGVLAATAFAVVEIYSNGFNSRHAFKEIQSADGGKKCKRSWIKKNGQMKIQLSKGPDACTYKLPVQGDASQPDYRIEAKGKISKKTNRKVREDAYLTVAVRVGGGKRYELRVTPKTQEFSLRRQPGGGGFPSNGTNADIGKIGEKNVLLLVASGNEIRAKANGADLATVNDGNASEIGGRKLEFGIGSEADTKKDTVGSFSKVLVSVPSP